MVPALTCQPRSQSKVDYACDEGIDVFDVDDGYRDDNGCSGVDCSAGDGVLTLLER